MQETGRVSRTQQMTSLKHAKKRKAEGKSPFYNQKDDVVTKYKKGK
jgi:hypothetical protein